MPYMLNLILRTILMYAVIFVTMRIMGKREIGKLSIFDLVISIMIAEIAVFVLDDVNKPIWHGLAPIAVLVTIQVGLAYFSLKSRKLRTFVDGRPSIIVSNGQLHRREMARLRYNLDDLMLQLRGKDIDSLADVDFAILETSGQLTVIRKDSVDKDKSSRSSASSDTSSRAGSNTNSSSDSESGSKDSSHSGDSDPRGSSSVINTEEPIEIPYDLMSTQGLPIPLILDGEVQDENLKILKKSRSWLKDRIREGGADKFDDVFLCSVDHKGQFYIDRKKTN
ncbi:DUF421 domain-containing protein [Paenibacillus sp. FSL M8-0334]|uniref:DUF421 domain-containing protein n=1 Tax=Paenibacillus sp. FSL M8-0334 TaxID=2921623 RepID=UPI0030F71A38